MKSKKCKICGKLGKTTYCKTGKYKVNGQRQLSKCEREAMRIKSKIRYDNWKKGILPLPKVTIDYAEADFIKKPEIKPRLCLKCGCRFPSEGIYNRVCGVCNGKNNAVLHKRGASVTGKGRRHIERGCV